MLRDLHASDLPLDVLAIEEEVLTIGIDSEAHLDLREPADDLLDHRLIPTEESLPEGIEGNASIHGAGIYVCVAEGAGETLGDGALATGGVAVEGDIDLLAVCHYCMRLMML